MAFTNTFLSASFTMASTPSGMSSFFATQTFFSTNPDPEPTSATTDATTKATSSDVASAVTASTSSKTETSSSSLHTSTSSQASHAVAPISSASVGTDAPSIIISPTGSTLSTSFTSAAAASATDGSPIVLSEQKQCSGISCSPGLQAAVAVPVALVGLTLIIAIIIFARRRRRTDTSSETSNGEPRGSKWARHLRVFSFDAELLIGGRSSTAGSLRSHPTTRSHPSLTSLRSQQPSVRSLESPAPPYRDAIAAGNVQMSERPESQLTAPPPYIANRSSLRPHSRLSAVSRPATAASDPFADPEDDAPNSPTSSRPAVRRTSSAYHPVADDDASFLSSEAGSIRQAEVARRINVTRES